MLKYHTNCSFTSYTVHLVSVVTIYSAGILEKSMGARNRVGIRLKCRPARLHMLASPCDKSFPTWLLAPSKILAQMYFSGVVTIQLTKRKILIK
jgi:hypothetical protein